MTGSKNSYSRKSDFAESVYKLCRKVPSGKVTTYKEIAGKLKTKSYRAVGQALRCNPYAPIIPCHRVISNSGSIGGFKGKTKGNEIQEKMKLLEKERVKIINGKIDLEKYLFKF